MMATINQDGIPCFIRFGLELESVEKSESKLDYHALIARNFLRFLVYNQPLTFNIQFKLKIITHLFVSKNTYFLDALRVEIHIIFSNAFNFLQGALLTKQDELKIQIFIDMLLSTYAFLEPIDNALIDIPIKLNQRWELVQYTISRINISPTKGTLGKLLTHEFSLYAYGLKATRSLKAKPHLLFMGTTFPTGQGAGLIYLNNFYPGKTIGENHDFSKIYKWAESVESIKIIGHSLGGTMALVQAAMLKNKVSTVICFYPALMKRKTFKQLKSMWNTATQKPEVILYTHPQDLVFSMGDCIWEDAKVYHAVNSQFLETHSLFNAHIKNIFLLSRTDINEIHITEKMLKTRKRVWVNVIKTVLDIIVYPILYVWFIIKLSAYNIIEKILSQKK